MKKVCAYAICKNEISHIEQWLQCVKEADEVVVLDTGSTDGTWEILQQSGIKCAQSIIEPFRFDVARNEALSLVSKNCDICLPLDIDMTLPRGWAQALRKDWENDLFILEIAQYYKNTNNSGIWFAHNRDCTWKYPVYEQVEGEGMNKTTIGTIIIHDWQEGKTVHQDYLNLIDLAIKENPRDPYCKKAKKTILKELEKIKNKSEC